MLYAISIGLLISIILSGIGVYIKDTNISMLVKNNRQEMYSGVDNTQRIFKRTSTHNIDYINNQYSKDSLWNFDIISTGDFEYKLKLIDYDTYSNPKLYVDVYNNLTDNDIIDNVKNYDRIKNGTNILGDTIDLNNLDNGLYIITPDGNNEITIKGTDVNNSLEFMFTNDDGSGIIWELKKVYGDNVEIRNILKQGTKIGDQIIENYFQNNAFNGTTILNN